MVLRREQGRLPELSREMTAELVDGDSGVEGGQPPWLRRELRVLPAWIAAELGRGDEARSELDRLAENQFQDLPDDGAWWMQNAARLAEVCAFLRDARRAALLYDLLLPATERYVVNPGKPAPAVYHGAVAHYLGLLATTQHRWDEAVRHFEDALALHLRMGARPWQARTQLAYAVMLRERRAPGDRDRALSLMRDALATYEQLGAGHAADAVREALETPQADATRQVTVPLTFPDGLSAREVEVLCMVAEGRSNREIADALVLSVITVQNHIANIYRKTGLRSRAEAATYALRHGLQ
jgi:DNA-binding CsgD family transcriptional regulator